MFKEYLLQNWVLILILFAYAVALRMTVSLAPRSIKRMYLLIGEIFLLSIVVYVEFYLADRGLNRELRVVLMALRYSATPIIIAQVLYTMNKELHRYIFIPAALHGVINFISIFTGIVFRIDSDNVFRRGPLGLLPYIMAGAYCVFLIYILYTRSNKKLIELSPIGFLCFAFALGLFLPFVFGSAYSQIFCATIAIALFTYYVFSVLQVTRKDLMTGMLNRSAYYADIYNNPEDISALVSLDMNGLKTINDTDGHAAGDDALITLAICFMRALKRRQAGYRVGGDEFIIVCRKCTRDEVLQLIERIRANVAETPYSCAVGFSYISEGTKDIDALLRESDAMMYAEKAQYYESTGKDRRRN